MKMLGKDRIRRVLDPEKYFIIVPDMFGNGFSTSPSHQEYANDRSQFPAITLYDNGSPTSVIN